MLGKPYDSDLGLSLTEMNATKPRRTPAHEAAANRLADFIMFSQRNLILRLSPELNQGKVSYPQFFLLAYLEEEGSLSMSSIAHMMGHSTAAATGMIDKLEALGHLRRTSGEADRRRIMVHITEQGRLLVARMRSNIARDLAELMAEKDDERLRKVGRDISVATRRKFPIV